MSSGAGLGAQNHPQGCQGAPGFVQERRRASAGGASTSQGSAFARAGPGPNFRAGAAGFKEEST